VLGSVLLAELTETSWPLLTCKTEFKFRNAVPECFDYCLVILSNDLVYVTMILCADMRCSTPHAGGKGDRQRVYSIGLSTVLAELWSINWL
jgi:hypothetical protein